MRRLILRRAAGGEERATEGREQRQRRRPVADSDLATGGAGVADTGAHALDRAVRQARPPPRSPVPLVPACGAPPGRRRRGWHRHRQRRRRPRPPPTHGPPPPRRVRRRAVSCLRLPCQRVSIPPLPPFLGFCPLLPPCFPPLLLDFPPVLLGFPPGYRVRQGPKCERVPAGQHECGGAHGDHLMVAEQEETRGGGVARLARQP